MNPIISIDTEMPLSPINAKGITYYSTFKPSATLRLADGITIVPLGWGYLHLHNGGKLRVCRSGFQGPLVWTDQDLWQRFRDWVIFDSFTMHHNGTEYFDNNLFKIDTLLYSVESGIRGDKADRYNLVDYSDVTAYLINETAKPDYLPSLSYDELYARFRALSVDKRELLEWYVSRPPSPGRADAFFGEYWTLLHLTILIEKIIGLPPNCNSKIVGCEDCGTIPQPHYVKSRTIWLRDELSRHIKNEKLEEEYAKIIDKAKLIRNTMCHKPHFDRSRYPNLEYGVEYSYDNHSAIAEFKEDSIALDALCEMLKYIAHALLADIVLDVKHYRSLSTLNAKSG